MFDLIVLIIIVYIIVKKSKFSSSNIFNLLNMNDFQNVTLLKHTSSSNYYTAQKAGDNYLIQVMEIGRPVSQNTIIEFADLAQKGHYHNMILIPTSIISDTAKREILKYNIQILDINQKVSSDESIRKSSFIQKMPIDDNCPIDEPQDAIQDGKKANSIFGSLFGNKIERL